LCPAHLPGAPHPLITDGLIEIQFIELWYTFLLSHGSEPGELTRRGQRAIQALTSSSSSTPSSFVSAASKSWEMLLRNSSMESFPSLLRSALANRFGSAPGMRWYSSRVKNPSLLLSTKKNASRIR